MSLLADLLEAHFDSLLKQWVDLVGSTMAPGPRSVTELADHMPTFLRQVIAALRGPTVGADGARIEGKVSVGRDHGAQRFRLGFSAGAVVHEYGLLLRVALDLVESTGAAIAMGEMRRLNELFMSAMAEAVDEHARRRAERHELHDLFMESPVAISILEGPEHVFTLANTAYRALVGGRDVVGKPLLEALPDVAGMGFDTLLDRVMATAEPFYGNEVKVKLDHHAEGESLVLNYIYVPKRDAEGRVDGVLMSGIDVTEQVRARDRAETLADRLRESEARLRRVLDASGAGLWDLDVASGRIEADARLIALMGLPHGTLLSLDLALTSVHEDDRARVGAAVAAALAGANDGRYLTEFRTAGLGDAPLRWVESRAQVLFDAERKAVSLAGAMLDITARKVAEIAQRHLHEESLRSEAGFRTLAESLPDTVWTADPQGRIRWMNSVLPRATGRPVEELRGGFRHLVHPEDRDLTVSNWTRAVASGEPFVRQHRVRQHDGAFRWHLVRIHPTRDVGGAIDGWIGTSTDIHDQREHQAELERRHDFEQHLVGIVSHDLRSPLSAILLGATALLEEEQSEWTTKIVHRIRSSAEWSTRLIRDLLDFTEARLGGGIKLERRAANLYALTRTVVDEVEATYPDRDLRLTRDGDTAGTWDADRVVQVVTNLATNALKYSPAGTPVTLRVSGVENAVELVVHNQGTPIPPEQISRLFEPLQRATDQIDRKTRSVGLGLYIVEAIVKAHGGTVSVVSTEAEGTRFTVRLPRKQA